MCERRAITSEPPAESPARMISDGLLPQTEMRCERVVAASQSWVGKMPSSGARLYSRTRNAIDRVPSRELLMSRSRPSRYLKWSIDAAHTKPPPTVSLALAFAVLQSFKRMLAEFNTYRGSIEPPHPHSRSQSNVTLHLWLTSYAMLVLFVCTSHGTLPPWV